MPTDDVGGVEARGSGEGICLRRSMHDHYTRRAALDSSPDDEQHELPSAGAPRKVRYPVGYVEDELQQEGLEYSAGTRSRTGRAGPRGAGKQARAQRHMMRSRGFWPACRSPICFSFVPRRGESQRP